MKTFLTFALASACTVAVARTPANNPMPDGSRDMYVGLGVVSASNYEGASENRSALLPLLQAEFSNGVFVAGMSLGMHWSSQPSLEFGPLLAVQPGRSESGSRQDLLNVTLQTASSSFTGAVLAVADSKYGSVPAVPPTVAPETKVTYPARPWWASSNRLTGLDRVKARLQGGGFFNYYLSPRLRITNSLLYGAGNKADGLVWNLGLQHLSASVAAHHALSLSAGVTVVNASYNQTFFGVTHSEYLRSYNHPYTPRGGVKDVNAGARWHWALSPSWMLVNGAQVMRLQGDAKRSPLIERPTSYTVFSALAYRF